MAKNKNTTATADKPADKPAVLAPSFEDVEELPKATRGRSRKPNPYQGAVRQSADQGKAKACVLPADQVDDATRLIRRGAAYEELGVSIRTEELEDGSVRVTFQGREKRQYNV